MLTELLNEKLTLTLYLEFFIRIILSCVCGAVIGLERSRRLKEAGVRTHLLVSCAAAMIMIISKYGFSDLPISALRMGDIITARVALIPPVSRPRWSAVSAFFAQA